MNSPFPLLQFQAYNPMDTMIRTAMDTYSGINTGIQQRAQREYMKEQQKILEEQQKYYGPMQEAQMGLIGAQTTTAQIEAQRAKAILNFMNSQLNPEVQNGGMTQMPVYQNGGEQAGSVSMPAGQAPAGAAPAMNGGAAQMPQMQSMAPTMANAEALRQQPQQQAMQQPGQPITQSYMGPSPQLQMARSIAGFPPVTAQEQYQMDIAKSQNQKMIDRNFETQYGTTTSLSDIQKQQRGIETFVLALDDLIKSDVPGIALGFGSTPNSRNRYDAKVNNALQKLIAAEGWKGTEADKQEGLQLLKRQDGETEANYKERLKFLRGQILETNNVLEQIKTGNSGSATQKHSYTQEDIEYTAKKYGMTPEQVMQRLNNGGM